jgi:hypothetical protein
MPRGRTSIHLKLLVTFSLSRRVSAKFLFILSSSQRTNGELLCPLLNNVDPSSGTTPSRNWNKNSKKIRQKGACVSSCVRVRVCELREKERERGRRERRGRVNRDKESIKERKTERDHCRNRRIKRL